jgi:H+/Cl- antiporter ClcA
MTTPPDPQALLRSRACVTLLVMAAVIGVPISAIAWGFLALVNKLQGWIFTSLPHGLGFHTEPLWWPIPPLVLSGLVVALTIRYLPGDAKSSVMSGVADAVMQDHRDLVLSDPNPGGSCGVIVLLRDPDSRCSPVGGFA